MYFLSVLGLRLYRAWAVPRDFRPMQSADADDSIRMISYDIVDMGYQPKTINTYVYVYYMYIHIVSPRLYILYIYICQD